MNAELNEEEKPNLNEDFVTSWYHNVYVSIYVRFLDELNEAEK